MADGIDYYRPVAPETPTADNTGAKIIANADLGQTFLRGLAAFADITQNRQRQELAIQQMAQNTALDQQKFGLAKEIADHNYQLDQEKVGIAGRLADYKISTDHTTDTAKAAAAANLMNQVQSVSNELAGYHAAVAQSGVNTINPANPIAQQKAWTMIKEQYGPSASSIPEIGKDMARIDKQMAETAVSLPWGVLPGKDAKTFDTSKAKPKRFTPGQIMESLYDPNTHDTMLRSLEVAGYITPNKVPYQANAGPVGYNFDKTDTFQQWLNQGADVKWNEHATPRPSVTKQPQWRAKLGGGQTEPVAYDHDTELSNAMAAIRDGAPIDGVKQRFQAKGFDPAELGGQ